MLKLFVIALINLLNFEVYAYNNATESEILSTKTEQVKQEVAKYREETSKLNKAKQVLYDKLSDEAKAALKEINKHRKMLKMQKRESGRGFCKKNFNKKKQQHKGESVKSSENYNETSEMVEEHS